MRPAISRPPLCMLTRTSEAVWSRPGPTGSSRIANKMPLLCFPHSPFVQVLPPLNVATRITARASLPSFAHSQPGRPLATRASG